MWSKWIDIGKSIGKYFVNGCLQASLQTRLFALPESIMISKLDSVFLSSSGEFIFEKQGQTAFNIFEKDGFEKAMQWIKGEYKLLRLSPDDFVKLIAMIKIVRNNTTKTTYNK